MQHVIPPAIRAEVLTEALPFIQKHRGRLFVIKYGGSAMDDEHAVERLLRDILFLEAVGIHTVVIHGGGKAITDRMREAGLKARFVNGLRVTAADSMRIVEEVLDGVVNPRIVSTINEAGGRGVGISGKQVFVGEKLPPQVEGTTIVDLGFVGEVADVQLAPIEEAVAGEQMPVISPIARDRDGNALNVNADIAAGTLAGALRADKMIYVSDVPGIMRDPAEKDSQIPSVNREMVSTLIDQKVISGGMIPKVQSALAALDKGVGAVHMIDGRIPHALLLSVFTDAEVGTELTA